MSFDPRPPLRRRALALLNRARVISEAPSAQPGSVSSSHPSSRPPTGTGISTLDLIGGELVKITAGDEEALREWVDWAEKVVDGVIRGRHVEPESRAQFHARVCTSYVGEPAPAVAYRECISVSLVRKIRAEGFDGRTFRPRDGSEILPEAAERTGILPALSELR